MLADDAYWLFHDDTSGRARVPARTAGTVLAAAVLAESSADGVLDVGPDAVRAAVATGRPTGPGTAGEDPSRLDVVAAEVLARVLAEPDTHPLRDWLAALARDAPHLVGRRLAGTGAAVERRVRRGLRRDVMYLPTDPIAAAWPTARLTTGVRAGRRLEPADTFLLGLAWATPLAGDVLADTDPDRRRHALDRIAHLPPPWLALVEVSRVAVAAGVLTNRT
ncbi:MAG: GPP34 family phosphoprotein [Kineosporiaceae bacterium]